MYITNTKKELLGANKFEASGKIKTEADFNAALKQVIDDIILPNEKFIEEYGEFYDECNEFYNEKPNVILGTFIEFMNDNDLSVPKLDKAAKVVKDMYGVNTIDMDYIATMYYDDADITKVISIDGKFACMYNLSSEGDDSLCVVASIVYFDKDMNVCIYVPTYGNTRVPGTDCILGNTDLYDNDYLNKFIEKHEDTINEAMEDYDLDDVDEDILRQYLAYKEEFGITEYGEREWIEESMCCWECDVRPNEEYITEDIRSNVILV